MAAMAQHAAVCSLQPCIGAQRSNRARCFVAGASRLAPGRLAGAPLTARPRRRSAPSAATAAPTALLHTAQEHAAGLLAQLADAAGDAEAAAKAAEQLAANKSGFLGTIANGLEAMLEGIDGGLAALHVPYSYGFSIIVLTLLVKLVTFPLSKKQIESTTAMQALQPRVKDLQARYANDQERLQAETAKLYQQAGVNPLAGCLPSLATLPVFIGLYRALTNAASDGLLTDGFFWIPSLGGPSSMGDNASGRGLGWLFPLVDGAPPIGWHDAASYLVLPVLLVVSQFASQKIMQPNHSTDPSQASANAILKFLPFMIGWFSLNVPSGLTLYWLVNNVLTTAQTVYLRQGVATTGAAAGAASSSGMGGKPLPPNPPRTMAERKSAEVAASRAVIDVEVMEGSSRSASGDAAERPGARFAQLKAAEASRGKSVKGPPRRPGGSAPNVQWAKEPESDVKASEESQQ